jgi:hypothetical protein
MIEIEKPKVYDCRTCRNRGRITQWVPYAKYEKNEKGEVVKVFFPRPNNCVRCKSPYHDKEYKRNL